MRHLYQEEAQDEYGNAIGGATITVYLAGSTALADVYGGFSGGSAVNTVESGTDGKFSFYVDDSEYVPSQRFKIVVSKSGYTSTTWDYLEIIPDDAHLYYVDATATDQGAVTSRGDRSIKDLVDDIGTSKSATLVLPHSGTGNTTTYTLTTSEIVPSNIALRVENGAILDGAGTLTINGTFGAGLHKVFGSSITVSGLTLLKPEWFGATGDGSTDDHTALSDTLSAAGVGSTIKLKSGSTYITHGGLSSAVKIRIYGFGTLKTKAGENYDSVLELSGAESDIANIEIDQSPTTSNTGDAKGLVLSGNYCKAINVKITGTGPANEITNSNTFQLSGDHCQAINCTSLEAGRAAYKTSGTSGYQFRIIIWFWWKFNIINPINL